MPRPMIALLCVLAIPCITGAGRAALADERRPATVTYGAQDEPPAFVPRRRVQSAGPVPAALPPAVAIVVVRGRQTGAAQATPGGASDLLHALASLCHVDSRQRDMLANGLLDSPPIAARF